MFLPQVVKSRARDEAGGRLPAALHGGARRTASRASRRARSSWRRSRATSTTSARTSSAWCCSATTTRSSTSASWCRPRHPGVANDNKADMIGLSGLITPVARRDGDGGRGDGAAGLQAAAADRRRHDLEGPHGGEDRAAATRARPCMCSTPRARSACARACSRSRARRPPTSPARSAAEYEKIRGRSRRRRQGKAGHAGRRRAPTPSRSTGGLHAAQARASRARACSPSIRCTSWSSASTGRRSSAPGSWPATIRRSSRTRWWARARASSIRRRAQDAATASCARSG